MSIEFSDSYLGSLWESMDWAKAEEKLSQLQERLTIAAFKHDSKEISDLQKRIVRDIDIKCLAVRHVVNSTSSPGVDGVKWKTPGEMMRAAMSLTSKDYHASPMRQILIIAKNTGKERRPRLPTFYEPGHECPIWILPYSCDGSNCSTQVLCFPTGPVDTRCPCICPSSS